MPDGFDPRAREGFTVTLSGADGNTEITAASASGSIVADDIGIAISAGAASVVEGADGSSRVLQFTVTRTGDTASSVSIDWAASGMDADDFGVGTALSGRLGFAANETSKVISLTQAGDNLNESNETLTLTLSNPVDNPAHDRTYITTATASTDVTNDDSTFAITGGAGASTAENTAQTFTITRTHNTNQNQTITWSVLTGGANGTVDAPDFGGTLPSGSVTFAPGEMSKTITITPTSDTTPETDETYNIHLLITGQDVTGLAAFK